MSLVELQRELIKTTSEKFIFLVLDFERQCNNEHLEHGFENIGTVVVFRDQIKCVLPLEWNSEEKSSHFDNKKNTR